MIPTVTTSKQKTKMKNYIKFFSLILIMIASQSGFAQSSNEFTIPLTDPAKRGKLKAHLNSGSITVKGTSRKDVLIRYSVDEDEDDDHKVKVKHKHDNDNDGDDNRSGLKRIGGGGLDFTVTEHQNTVNAQSDSWNQEMKLEVEVPMGFDLQLHTYNNGDLLATNIQGQLELTNYNGEITALNISGSVVATTYNGEIKITYDKVTENTPMSYSTYNGDVDLTYPANYKASFKIKTEQGDIYSDFDVQFTSTGPVQKTDSKNGVRKVVVDEWKRCDINGGGAEIAIRNYNGDILIRKK